MPDENERMLNAIEGEKVCCGKPMAFFGEVNNLDMNIDSQELWLCLECGGFITRTEGQFDLEEVINHVKSFGTDADRKKFAEFHPELAEEVMDN